VTTRQDSTQHSFPTHSPPCPLLAAVDCLNFIYLMYTQAQFHERTRLQNLLSLESRLLYLVHCLHPDHSDNPISQRRTHLRSLVLNQHPDLSQALGLSLARCQSHIQNLSH
jgi:hypothetical protein